MLATLSRKKRSGALTVICCTAILAVSLSLSAVISVLDCRIQAAQVLPGAEEYMGLIVPTFSEPGAGSVSTFQNGGYDRFSLVHSVEIRKIAAAYSPSLRPVHVLSRSGEESVIRDMPSDFFVGVVTCEQMLYENIKPGSTHTIYEDAPIINTYRYGFECRLSEAIYLFESDPVPQKITVEMLFYHEDLPMPMKPGGTYLIWGSLKGYEDGTAVLELVHPSGRSQTPFITEDRGLHFSIEPISESGFVVPLLSELRTSLDEFRKTEVGRAWEQDIFPKGEIQQHSVKLIGTSDMDTVLSFHRGTSYLVEGVMPEDADRANSCIISRALAEKNGFAVGDMLTCSLYENNQHYPSYLYARTYDMRVGFLEEVSLCVVGIYETEDDPHDPHGIHPSTVYVDPRALTYDYGPFSYAASIFDNPKNNDSATFVDDRYALLIAVDAAEAFYKEAKVSGYPEQSFTFYDGGYAEDSATWKETDAAMKQLQERNPLWATIAVGLLTVISAVMLVILVMSARRAIEQKYRMDTPRQILFRYLCIRQGIPLVAACAVSAAFFVGGYRHAARGWISLMMGADGAEPLLAFLPGVPNEGAGVCLILAFLLAVVGIAAKLGAGRRYHYPIIEIDHKEGEQ